MDPISPIVQSRSNHITVISMAVFVLMSLTIVGFLYYQNQELKKIIADYQTSTPAPTIAPVEIAQSASPSAAPTKIKIATPSAKPKIAPTPSL